MAKYRNNSQKIGELGEDLFRIYAQRSLNLIPNKLERDYGIDFSCQIGSESTSHKQSMHAEFLLVNVKSSANDIPSSNLNKADMEFTLKSTQPLVFILVDTLKNEIYHRFFDEKLLLEFHERLSKKKNSFRLDPSKMSNDVDHFIEQLSIIKKRSYQNKLDLLKVQLELQKLIGDMKLSISQSEEGSVAIVEVNQVEDLFDKTHKLFPRVRTSFLSEDLNKLSLPQSTFKNIFQHTDDIADSLSVIAPLVYDVCRVTLMRKGKEIATCQFEIRGFGDETAYYHPSGLSLSVSRRRKAEDNQFRHYTEVIITEKNADSMFNYPELINFLGKIRPGDTINQLSVSESWPILLYLGEVVRHLPKIYDALAVEPCVQLNALENKETWFSYMFVAKLLFDKKSTLHYNPETDNSTLKVIKNKIHCPFIICLPEGQFVLIMEFDSELYREESGRIVGIKSTRNPIAKSCIAIESIGISNPIFLLTEEVAFMFSADKQQAEIIDNPLGIRSIVL